MGLFGVCEYHVVFYLLFNLLTSSLEPILTLRGLEQ